MEIEEIKGGETDRLEFKRALSKDDAKWLKTVVAFANGRGGRIIFGVDSDRSVVGIGDDLFSVKDSIADAIANRIVPFPPADIAVTTLEGKPVIVVEVAQGMQCPYYLKAKGVREGVYVRYDATTRSADENILKELLIDGEGKSFDQQICRGLKVSEKDIEKLCRRMKTVARRNAKNDEQRKAVKPVTKAQLVKWGVLVERGKELLPTWAYVLLTGNARLSPLVKCGVFKGEDRAIFVDRREFESPVQDQVESAVQYVLEKINMGAKFNGVYREDVYEIPPDSLRELIVNAVVHRLYIDAEASPITVALHPNRLEITSPGGLPRGMTVEKMMTGYSKCRNKAIAKAFAYMNLIENWGSGIKRCLKEFRAAGLSVPEVIDWGNAIRVNVYRKGGVGNRVGNVGNVGNADKREDTGTDTNDTNRDTNDTNHDANETNAIADRIRTAMLRNPMVSMPSLSAECGVSRPTIARTIKSLKERGAIRREGGTRGKWVVLEP